MSGLVAIVSRAAAARARGPAALARLAHTPAFESACAEAGRLWMGACGLPGTASVGSPAPAADAATSTPVVAAVAGHILNGAALRRELGLAPGSDDAGLVAAAYAAWGAGLFGRLEGRFALVVHDEAADLTLAGNDPYGVLPLVRTSLGDDLLLATEAKALTADPRFPARLDEAALGRQLLFGQQYGEATLFAGVLELEQGTHFELRGDKAERRPPLGPARGHRPQPARGSVCRAPGRDDRRDRR